MLLNCKVQPGASNSAPRDIREGRLCLRIAAAPEDGKANNELRSFMAGLLGCAKRDVVLQSGERSRLKTLALPISTLENLRAILAGISYNGI